MSDAQPFAEWIGRTETVENLIAPAPAQAAAATLDESETQFGGHSELPPLWHWFYFLPKLVSPSFPQIRLILWTDGGRKASGGRR